MGVSFFITRISPRQTSIQNIPFYPQYLFYTTRVKTVLYNCPSKGAYLFRGEPLGIKLIIACNYYTTYPFKKANTLTDNLKFSVNTYYKIK